MMEKEKGPNTQQQKNEGKSADKLPWLNKKETKEEFQRGSLL